jgi:hypothetical protein
MKNEENKDEGEVEFGSRDEVQDGGRNDWIIWEKTQDGKGVQLKWEEERVDLAGWETGGVRWHQF